MLKRMNDTNDEIIKTRHLINQSEKNTKIEEKLKQGKRCLFLSDLN